MRTSSMLPLLISRSSSKLGPRPNLRSIAVRARTYRAIRYRVLLYCAVVHGAVAASACFAQDDDAAVERKKQDFVSSQVRETVSSQLMAPVLIRVDDLTRFLELPAEDSYRLQVACKGAASVVADNFRFPTAVVTHRPWKEVERFSINGRTVEFPEELRGDSKIPPPAPQIKVTVGAARVQINVNYGRNSIGTSVQGGLDAVFAHELFRRTRADLVTDEQLKEYEKHRTERMRIAIAKFLGASLDVRLTLQDDQKQAVNRWLIAATTDVAANPDNEISQNAHFLIREIEDAPLKMILSKDQWELWQAIKPLFEQKRW